MTLAFESTSVESQDSKKVATDVHCPTGSLPDNPVQARIFPCLFLAIRALRLDEGLGHTLVLKCKDTEKRSQGPGRQPHTGIQPPQDLRAGLHPGAAACPSPHFLICTTGLVFRMK